MPRSKRPKTVALTQTRKQPKAAKQDFIKKVQDCFDQYAYVYTYSVENMRNAKLKILRDQLKDSSRFFYGKNKLIAIAFGRSPSEEYKPGAHRLVKYIKGDVGVLFTNKPRDEIQQWFQEHSEPEYARSGNIASETVRIAAGPLPQFSHTMEPHLRSLGLPTRLIRGVVTLTADHTICEHDNTLTPEQAKLLVHFEKKLVEFQILLLTFMDIAKGTIETLVPSDQLVPKRQKKAGDDSAQGSASSKQKPKRAAAERSKNEGEEDEDEDDDDNPENNKADQAAEDDAMGPVGHDDGELDDADLFDE